MQSVILKPRRRKSKEARWGLALASVPVLGFVIFGLIPMAFALIMALMNIRGYRFDEYTTFIGLKNFADILKDKLFYKSLINTLYAALSMPLSLVVSLVVSVLLNQQIKGKKFLRTVFFIPYVCSLVAITLMWQWIFDYNYGVLNSLVSALGGKPVNWLGDAATFMPSMILMGVWSGTGFGIILYSAALTNVNPVYYEAAEIDGANAPAKFFHITLPAISPTTFYLVIMGLIGALQEFTRFQVMAPNGGPNNAGLTVVFYMYNYIFDSINMGKASATALLLSVAIIAVTVLNFRLSKKWVSYD